MSTENQPLQTQRNELWQRILNAIEPAKLGQSEHQIERPY